MCYGDDESAGVPREVYRWDESSFAALAAAEIHWHEAYEVLYEAWPRMRRHFGNARVGVAGQLRDGRWVGVLIQEESDDHYLVLGARELDDDEVDDLSRMIGRDL